MKKIFLDTSFLLTSLKDRVDIFRELERICNFTYSINIVDKTIEELEGKKLGKLALAIVKDKITVIKTTEDLNVDQLLLKETDSIVATQDKKLKEKLKKAKIPVITIRKKKYLIIEGAE